MITISNYKEKKDTILKLIENEKPLLKAHHEILNLLKMLSDIKSEMTQEDVADFEGNINVSIEKINKFINKNKKKQAPEKKEVKTKEKSQKKEVKMKTTSTKFVEEIEQDINFIKRYAAIHSKIKTRSSLLNLLQQIQKAIIKKRIKKTSPFSTEISKIQDNLIKAINSIDKDSLTEIEINIVDIEKYKEIAKSEKVLLSISYINRFINMTGRRDIFKKSNRLETQIEKALENGKISKRDKYFKEISNIKDKLHNFNTKKDNTIKVTETELNGLNAICDKCNVSGLSGTAGNLIAGVSTILVARVLYDKLLDKKTTVPKLPIPTKKDTITLKDPKIINSLDLKKIQYDPIGLQNKYKQVIGNVEKSTSILIYGRSGHGKSTFAILFAKHLADLGKKVLFVSGEEGTSERFTEKFERLNCFHKNIDIVTSLNDADPNKYDATIFDSTQLLAISPEMVAEFKKAYPNTLKFYVSQVTKDGQHRGSEEYIHNVDVVLEAVEGVIYSTSKNRYNGSGEIRVF